MSLAVIANKRVNADENPCCSYCSHGSGSPEGNPLSQERGILVVGGSVVREAEGEGRLKDRRTDREIDPRREGRERSLSLRWTRIAVVEHSCSKESCRVSKRTGSTEAVQNIMNQEVGATGAGRRAEEIP